MPQIYGLINEGFRIVKSAAKDYDQICLLGYILRNQIFCLALKNKNMLGGLVRYCVSSYWTPVKCIAKAVKRNFLMTLVFHATLEVGAQKIER